MVRIVALNEIQEALKAIDPRREIIPAIQDGFVAYSQGRVVVPPVGELTFDDPKGETHIKYGYIKRDEVFVIKIASGFHGNLKLGIPTCHGLMLIFSQKTGELKCVLLDEGYLTQVRTAAAGAVVAKFFAPRNIRRVGVFGTGIQGRMQVEYLTYVMDIPEVMVWGLNQDEVDGYRADMEPKGFKILTTLDAEDIASTCHFIVTATPSCLPLLAAAQIRQGTHITAMGSDTVDKQELDPAIARKADRFIVDSLSQGLLRGEMYHALRSGLITAEKPIELGAAIADKKRHRASDEEITVVDLTGVAVQDIQIAKLVWAAIEKKG